MHTEPLKTHVFLEIIPLAVIMLLPLHGYVLIDIKLFLSVNVFKYTPLRVSGPKNKILPKPEVSHKKVKN